MHDSIMDTCSVSPTPASSPTLREYHNYVVGVSVNAQGAPHMAGGGDWVNSGLQLISEDGKKASSQGGAEKSHQAKSDTMDWRWEMRREAQQIIPNLWLGPCAVANKEAKLREMGVTHILCLRDSVEAHIVKPRFEHLFQYKTVDIRDHQDERLSQHLSGCLEFIRNAIDSGGVVYVHCMSGLSASPTVVMAYLMQTRGMTFEESSAYVQGKRYCTTINAGFSKQLWEYESICKAQLAMHVNTAPISMGNTNNSAYNTQSAIITDGGMMTVDGEEVIQSALASRKRTLDDDDDESVDHGSARPQLLGDGSWTPRHGVSVSPS